jgi:hypothetical protein
MVPPIPIIRGHGLGCPVHNNALFMCKKIWDTLEKQPTGWWCNVPILKNVKVSWEYKIPDIWKKNPNVPNHQPALVEGLSMNNGDFRILK